MFYRTSSFTVRLWKTGAAAGSKREIHRQAMVLQPWLFQWTRR
ncbi:MAG: hypothetical protein SOX70_02505 [Peptoniphilaceae bacterium]|nr:hypothetical protein [Peptoniphilaceae bacterium]